MFRRLRSTETTTNRLSRGQSYGDLNDLGFGGRRFRRERLTNFLTKVDEFLGVRQRERDRIIAWNLRKTLLEAFSLLLPPNVDDLPPIYVVQFLRGTVVQPRAKAILEILRNTLAC